MPGRYLLVRTDRAGVFVLSQSLAAWLVIPPPSRERRTCWSVVREFRLLCLVVGQRGLYKAEDCSELAKGRWPGVEKGESDSGMSAQHRNMAKSETGVK